MTAVSTSPHPLPPASTQPAPQTPIRFVSPDGSLTEQGKAHGIDLELARSLFRDMVLARRLDKEALALQRQGELKLWLMCWGQEAAQVGSVRALRDSDMAFPSYREHAAALCRGVKPAELMAQWRGIAHSGWDPKEHNFHIYSLVLGTQALHATGYAAGASLEGSDEVVATYFGDGAASQGDVNEAFNWAAAGSLPVLFFCQNNQWAISTPPALQMRTPVYQRAAGFGMPTWHVDGNDVLAVHAVTANAAARIRNGKGPALIEAETYRMGGHSSSDDPTRYRSSEEQAQWETRDPLTRLETLLKNQGTPAGFFESLNKEAALFAVSVREACASLKRPEFEDLFESVYAEPHTLLQEEQARHMAHVAALETEV